MALVKNHKEQITLDSATTHILEECRMVLPGIQALFGFQLIAVFNSGFTEKLSHFEQELHLISIVLIVVAVILVMAPAAMHRQINPVFVSMRFIQITSRLLLFSMTSLAVGLCLEVYLVSKVILMNTAAAVLVAAITMSIFIGLWVGLPCWEKKNGC
jgi:hypothetical protein